MNITYAFLHDEHIQSITIDMYGVTTVTTQPDGLSKTKQLRAQVEGTRRLFTQLHEDWPDTPAPPAPEDLEWFVWAGAPYTIHEDLRSVALGLREYIEIFLKHERDDVVEPTGPEDRFLPSAMAALGAFLLPLFLVGGAALFLEKTDEIPYFMLASLYYLVRLVIMVVIGRVGASKTLLLRRFHATYALSHLLLPLIFCAALVELFINQSYQITPLLSITVVWSLPMMLLILPEWLLWRRQRRVLSARPPQGPALPPRLRHARGLRYVLAATGFFIIPHAALGIGVFPESTGIHEWFNYGTLDAILYAAMFVALRPVHLVLSERFLRSMLDADLVPKHHHPMILRRWYITYIVCSLVIFLPVVIFMFLMLIFMVFETAFLLWRYRKIQREREALLSLKTNTSFHIQRLEWAEKAAY